VYVEADLVIGVVVGGNRGLAVCGPSISYHSFLLSCSCFLSCFLFLAFSFFFVKYTWLSEMSACVLGNCR